MYAYMSRTVLSTCHILLSFASTIDVAASGGKLMYMLYAYMSRIVFCICHTLLSFAIDTMLWRIFVWTRVLRNR